eukprot:675341_1
MDMNQRCRLKMDRQILGSLNKNELKLALTQRNISWLPANVKKVEYKKRLVKYQEDHQKTKCNACVQQKQLLVFGYVRHHETTMHVSIPWVLKHLIVKQRPFI